MYKIIWSLKSLSDLQEIKDFIAKGSIKYANITILSIIDSVEFIKTNPYFGREVPEIKDEFIREIIKGNYRVIYTFDKFSIKIITVHHSARDLRKRKLF